jgi:hypothetical protein
MHGMLLAFLLLTQSGTIEGRVLNIDGTPAASVRVAVQPVGDSAAGAALDPELRNIAETDSDGRYRLEAVPPGEYVVVAGALASPTYHPGVGLRKAAMALTVLSGSALKEIDFKLVPQIAPCKGCFKLSVKILSGPASPPLPQRGIEVTTMTGRLYTSVRAADGSYEFHVPAGTYRVRIASQSVLINKTVQVKDTDVEIDIQWPTPLPQ